MGLFSIVGNSFGCSASGERLVSAARDGDFQEAKALLEYNPRLARYSTFGGRNSPLHFAAARGHHGIVSLLIESGVDINLRNYHGQTALMQACQYGHWEVVQTLMIFQAHIHKTDYLNGGTAIHFAALNGHARCIRLLLTDYVPGAANFWDFMQNISVQDELCIGDHDLRNLIDVVNHKADGGITALHMAALNGHVECIQLLLDFGASVLEVTVEDGTTIDLIGAGSTPLHYAACGGNAVCCQTLIARGACITAKNSSGLTPLMVAQIWHRNWLEEILCSRSEVPAQISPSPYLCLPLMSIMNIARERGWRTTGGDVSPCMDPCAVCLEASCTVAAEGCHHELCTRCALYLCTTNNTSSVAPGPPGAIPCPLCRSPVVSFTMLAIASPVRSLPRRSLSLTLCATCPSVSDSPSMASAHLCRSESQCSSSSLRSTSCHPSMVLNLNPVFCMGVPEMSPCIPRCSRPGSNLRRTTSQLDNGRRSWPFAFNQITTTAAASS
ncbi:Ankyrin repeat family protein [Rhynchospora pubera]|uniref:RING-type E3 ubiquitin transferase n=1 Tax=Rhynchospora pubera TaxID=906938 RepID=A0AAV8HF35_9POAL|nr:Ankyrin repeat family protein [Rhynchospora pubera]